MEKIEINPDFKKALDLMEKTSFNIFVTGRAGTGKSTLLKYFREHTNKNLAILAPTGVAAVNVEGQTIHSFFGFRPDITVSKVRNSYKKVKKAKMYKKLEALVVDEISMVRADLLDCVNEFLKMHGPIKGKVFGGIQMIFFGDLYQLPPVVTSSDRKIFESVYESPYFFSANAMKNTDFEMIELIKIYRQEDQKFIEILNAVRNKSVDESLIEILNTRYNPQFLAPDSEFYIYLTTTNAKADLENMKKLRKLPPKEYIFEAQISGEFDQKSSLAPEILNLKVGAQIMLTNNDREGRWINGTVGKVVKIISKEDNYLIVELKGGEEVEVYPYTWEMYKFYFNEKVNKIDSETVGSFTQFPVILAWAITIHKSQGKTFSKAIIDFDRGTFTHGQAYVALSRCVSLEGLVLKKPFEKRHVMVDWKVSKYLTGYAYQKSEEKLSLTSKIEIIKSAILGNCKIEMVYLKADNTKSKRVVLPSEIGEMQYKEKSFIGFSGFDELRQEDRVFRVDRILEIESVI